MHRRLAVASICRSLPNPDDASSGIFVQQRLAAMGKQARLAVIQPLPFLPWLAPLPQWGRQPERKLNDLRIQHAPMFYFPKVLKSLDGNWLYRAIYHPLVALKESGQLDLIDAHFGYPEGVGALLAARRLGVPVVVTLRGFEAEYIHKPVIGRKIRNMLRDVDGCICVSHFLKDLAVAHGAPANRTSVIHNAIDRSRFYPSRTSVARRELGVEPDVPLLVSVGHVIARKRHHVLISAFASLLASFPNAQLKIVGGRQFDGDYVRRLEEQIADLGIGDCVSLLGNIPAEQVANYLRAADLFVLCTEREGCCNAVLEALACGVPVVTTPVGDNEFFVKDGVNGFIVPVDDCSATYRAMCAALKRDDWSREAISTSLEAGNWDDVATEVLAFQRQIASD